jgi:transposase
MLFLSDIICFCFCLFCLRQKSADHLFFFGPFLIFISTSITFFFLYQSKMCIFSPQLKHHILSQYQPHSHQNSYESLAARYNITGGGSTIRKWHDKWDGTPESLERKKGSGRPHLLTRTQVYRYISQPIIKKNRQHRPVHYPTLVESVRMKTGLTNISRWTVQREGKKLGVKKERGIKRTSEESKY